MFCVAKLECIFLYNKQFPYFFSLFYVNFCNCLIIKLLVIVDALFAVARLWFCIIVGLLAALRVGEGRYPVECLER